MFYEILFIGDRKMIRRQMITSPLELNDAVVSEIDGFITIASKSFETF